jgi:NADH-quinone oxidoreductase subunit L
MDLLPSSLLMAIWLVSLIPFLFIGSVSLLGFSLREKPVRVLVRSATILGFLLTVTLIFVRQLSLAENFGPLVIPWIRTPLLTYDLVLGFDVESLYFLVWSWIIVGAIGRFSSVYLQGSPNYQKFMILLLLLQWGVVTVVISARLDLLMLGWEVVGVASVLLIGFIQDTRFSGSGSLVAFTSYKVADVGLLLAGVFLHHIPELAVPYFHGIGHHTSTMIPAEGHQHLAFALGFCLIFGSLAKGSQFPFVSWLPRAMEGPTPSSAAFYGALSVHLGPLLLIKLRPYWAWSQTLTILVVGIGLLTAIYGTCVGRTAGNYKTQLAYAIMVQLGLIYIEVALGWEYLAIWHLCGHGALRTLQFLKAGSLLAEFAENPVFYTSRQKPLSPDFNDQAQSYWFQVPLKKIQSMFYALAWNEFYLRKLLVWLGAMTSRLRYFRVVKSRTFLMVLLAACFSMMVLPLSPGAKINAILGFGILAVLTGFNSEDFVTRIHTLALAHLALLVVCLEVGILSHSTGLLLNGIVILLLIGTAYIMVQDMERQLGRVLVPDRSLGLAAIFPKQSILFLAMFFILGISPGSLLFLAEDLLLEHMVQYGFSSLVLFLTLGFFLAVFLYRTYVQIFMGYDSRWRSVRVQESGRIVWLGRALVLLSIVISLIPQH